MVEKENEEIKIVSKTIFSEFEFNIKNENDSIVIKSNYPNMNSLCLKTTFAIRKHQEYLIIDDKHIIKCSEICDSQNIDDIFKIEKSKLTFHLQ